MTAPAQRAREYTSRSMPGTGGLAATRELLAESADARVVVLTGSFSVDSVREAQAIGAVGYLLKDGDPVEQSAGWESPVALGAEHFRQTVAF